MTAFLPEIVDLHRRKANAVGRGEPRVPRGLLSNRYTSPVWCIRSGYSAIMAWLQHRGRVEPPEKSRQVGEA